MAVTDAKADASHLENVTDPAHEAALTGALALASLFSNCVEAFGLIHPTNKWEMEEQLLLARLGIQQARLLIWGNIVGISSPPKSVTDRAVPKRPSSAYPDLTEPTFFGARDGRLDEAETRTLIENALSAIVDRSSSKTREEMMNKYGLKPPKRFVSDYLPALDTTRLEAFRERYELLTEVAESYAQLSAGRTASIVQNQWLIADRAKFSSFIDLTKEKVDFLVDLLGVKEGVDRGMRMDIRSFGWHLTADRARAAHDASKLRLIAQACANEYPPYVEAAQQALANIEREARENNLSYEAWRKQVGLDTTSKPAHHKRPGLLGLLKGFRKSREVVPKPGVSHEAPARSHSDAGPTVDPMHGAEDGGSLEPVRSKSVGAILDGDDPHSVEERMARASLQQETAANGHVLKQTETNRTVGSTISRHDQYHGIARTATEDLRQG